MELIRLSSAELAFGEDKILDKAEVSIQTGERICLVGRNGAGKSTLLKMLAGVESVTSGAVRIGSSVVSVYYAQHQLEILNPNETVFESIQKVSQGPKAQRCGAS